MVIGTIAALTIPSLNENVQSRQLQSQAKKAFSVLNQAVERSTMDLGYEPRCYHWVKNPYGSLICKTYNTDGSCQKYSMSDGSDVPPDAIAKQTDCSLLKKTMIKNLNIAKSCENNAAAKGCIYDSYKGIENVYKEINPGISDTDLAKFSKNNCAMYTKETIKNSSAVYVTADGMILFSSSMPIRIAVDVNGFKGPNKWGYDIYTFSLFGGIGDSIRYEPDGCNLIEKGGKSVKEVLLGIS